MENENGLTLQWLGVSGVALRCGGEAVLIDPLFSRPPLRRVALGRLHSDEAAVMSRAPACSHIFVTHPHYDHMLDAPLLSAWTGAALHGSENACAIASACGTPEDRLRRLAEGEPAQAGPFEVTALPASHLRLPGFGYGEASGRLAPPLHARQYRMDRCFVFRVCCRGFTLLIGPGRCLADPGPVDALLCCPLYLGRDLAGYVGGLNPRAFLPIHWDDMFRSTSLPLRPGWMPALPPRRLDMAAVRAQAEALGVKCVQPEPFLEYSVDELVGAEPKA